MVDGKLMAAAANEVAGTGPLLKPCGVSQGVSAARDSMFVSTLPFFKTEV